MFPSLTEKGNDYTVFTQLVRVFPNRLEDIVVAFQVDSIAQELSESFKLRLNSTTATTLPSGEGVFFRENLTLTIVDSDGMCV